jgi:hypothetical protein
MPARERALPPGKAAPHSPTNVYTQADLWTLRVTPTARPCQAHGAKTLTNPRPYLRTPVNEHSGRFSPEPSPRWVAYQSDESGQDEVYIAVFPDPRRKIRISRSGGTYPQWGRNRRELFYVAAGCKLMVVDLKFALDWVEPSGPRELFVLPALECAVSPFEAAPDGRRFLVGAQPQASHPLTVIVNWPALLKNGVPARGECAHQATGSCRRTPGFSNDAPVTALPNPIP